MSKTGIKKENVCAACKPCNLSLWQNTFLKNTVMFAGDKGSRKHQGVGGFFFFLFTWVLASASDDDDNT